MTHRVSMLQVLTVFTQRPLILQHPALVDEPLLVCWDLH